MTAVLLRKIHSVVSCQLPSVIFTDYANRFAEISAAEIYVHAFPRWLGILLCVVLVSVYSTVIVAFRAVKPDCGRTIDNKQQTLPSLYCFWVYVTGTISVG